MEHKILKVANVELLPLNSDKTNSSIYENLNKPVNVFFFVSSNCPYCIKEISDFAVYKQKTNIADKFPDVRFIICFVDDKEDVKSFLKKTNLNFANVYVLKDIESLRRLSIKYVPATFVINNGKNLIWYKIGEYKIENLFDFLKTIEERR